MLKKILIILLVITLFPLLVYAEFYQYKDQNGVIRFTDNLADIPKDQRPNIETYSEPDDNFPLEAKKLNRQKIEEVTGSEDEQKIDESTQVNQIEKNIDQANLDRLKELKSKKALLDEERTALAKEQKSLEKEKSTVRNDDQSRVYSKKARNLNMRVIDFKKRNDEFQKQVDAFNAQSRNP